MSGANNTVQNTQLNGKSKMCENSRTLFANLGLTHKLRTVYLQSQILQPHAILISIARLTPTITCDWSALQPLINCRAAAVLFAQLPLSSGASIHVATQVAGPFSFGFKSTNILKLFDQIWSVALKLISDLVGHTLLVTVYYHGVCYLNWSCKELWNHCSRHEIDRGQYMVAY